MNTSLKLDLDNAETYRNLNVFVKDEHVRTRRNGGSGGNSDCIAGFRAP
jgi:hypothetical protein